MIATNHLVLKTVHKTLCQYKTVQKIERIYTSAGLGWTKVHGGRCPPLPMHCDYLSMNSLALFMVPLIAWRQR